MNFLIFIKIKECTTFAWFGQKSEMAQRSAQAIEICGPNDSQRIFKMESI